MMAAYQAERWISEALASVLAQTVGVSEIVVVDDGSTDGTAAAVRQALRCTAVPWRLIETPNGGPSRARNLGWRAAKGAWIQFLDADDTLAPHKLAAQCASAEHALPETAGVLGAWCRVSETKGRRVQAPLMIPRMTGDPQASWLAAEGFFPLASALIRRAWLERVGGFDETLRMVEDIDLILRMAFAGANFIMAGVDEPGYFYRDVPGSLSADKVALARGIARNARMALAHWSAEGTLDESRRDLLAEILASAVHVLAAGASEEAAEVASVVERIAPGYLPTRSVVAACAARFLGLYRAERLAATMRGLKARFRA